MEEEEDEEEYEEEWDEDWVDDEELTDSEDLLGEDEAEDDSEG